VLKVARFYRFSGDSQVVFLISRESPAGLAMIEYEPDVLE